VQVIKAIEGAAMAKKETTRSGRQTAGSGERQAREAAALRENLRKRKAQQRQRFQAAGADQAAEMPLEPRRTTPDSSAE
jgi:hypothetical protein